MNLHTIRLRLDSRVLDTASELANAQGASLTKYIHDALLAAAPEAYGSDIKPLIAVATKASGDSHEQEQAE